ncbi:hypothetical protein CH300_16910 [Rhodococcus sp. 15-1154-1]|nr:thiamine pyrophosphate-binding protein [Rhodococcus sp. 15-1154-1]OZF02519.1 hypothetical protein CH300_16910 [Rhodococcus sp. 15-1154-1]
MIGNDILAKSLTALNLDRIYFIMGGPFIEAHNACEDAGLDMIDVRHEQSAALMAIADTRIRRKVNVAMACSGPGVMNLVTGVAHAFADCAPLLVLGGAAALTGEGKGTFQDGDQLAVFRPITKAAVRCPDARRIPEVLANALRTALNGKPGPVYVEFPGDVLYSDVPDDEIIWPAAAPVLERTAASPSAVEQAIDLLGKARRPIVIAGSGVVWSSAEEALVKFTDELEIPTWTTPLAKGVVDERGPLSFPSLRSTAFGECDVIIQIGTRQNYVFDYFSTKRFNSDAQLIQIDISPTEIGRNRAASVALVGDARTVLDQLLDAPKPDGLADRYEEWRSRLNAAKSAKDAALSVRDAERSRESTSDAPIHPAELCRVVQDWLPEDATVVTDGHEILSFARQTFAFDRPRSLNSGTYGTMGVGVPFAIGAKLAAPDRPVVLLQGDGSFGFNGFEIDTAIRHEAPFICIISNNGGWSAANKRKVGRDLGYTRYDEMFAPLGCYTAHIEDIEDLIPVLDKALASGKPAVINVITDATARAQTAKFTEYAT